MNWTNDKPTTLAAFWEPQKAARDVKGVYVSEIYT